MPSPFAVFRRNQKILTVILTCLAMFAFIILDSVSKMDTAAIMPIIFGIGGAALAWLWGSQNERGISYSTISFGAIAGAIAGVMIISQASNQGGVHTGYGRVSDRQLFEMKQKRDTANQFIAGVFRERKENAYAFLMDRYTFGGTSTREVVTQMLLEREADRLGVAISDDFITNYIKEVSEKSITHKALTKLRGQMGLGESEIYDLLRAELRAQVAYRVLNPELVHMPDQYWADFGKLNVRHSIDAVAVPVEAFAKRLDRPSDAELQTVFEAFKSVYPMGENPGFIQSDRLKLAWFESDYEAAEKLVGEIPEDELKARYAERKETDYKIETLPDLGAGFDDGGLKFGEPPAPVKTPDGSANPGDAPSEDAPPADATKTDTPAADPKGELTTPPTSDAPADAPKKAESPAADAPKSETPADSPPETSDSKPESDESAECADVTFDENESTAAEEDAPVGENVKPETTEKPVATDSPEDKSASGSKPAEESKDEKKDVTAVDAPAPSDVAADDVAKKESDTDPGDAAKGDAAPESGSPVSGIKYRAFEDVRDEIRDLMLREKTDERIRTQISAALVIVKDWRFNLREETPDISNEDLARAIARKATAYGIANGLKFVEIGDFVSQQELIDHKEYRIGSAREPFEMSAITTRTETQTVATRLFTGATSLFIPEEAEGQFDDTRYAYWSTDEQEQHVPTLDEPGVREKVEEAVRLQKARPEAEARARKLAEELKAKFAESSIVSLSEGIVGQSVLGEAKPAVPAADASDKGKTKTAQTPDGTESEVKPAKDDGSTDEAAADKAESTKPQPADKGAASDPLSVISSPPFTWLRQSFQGMQANPFAQPSVEFGVIPGIDGVDDNFMQTVADATVGDVVVIPNFTKQIYYVVHVKARNPSGIDDPSLGPIRQQFIAENAPSSPIYSRLANSQSSVIHQRWLKEFLSKHDVDIAELDAI
ncbi:MAG: hypothetical protein O3B13_15900 [Planctomycetota bacterium]|nr:hypothetical protein [Planctomycetota bacterium]MDA1164575.1 hypothetical protein [Planctomycetota bacterium]